MPTIQLHHYKHAQHWSGTLNESSGNMAISGTKLSACHVKRSPDVLGTSVCSTASLPCIPLPSCPAGLSFHHAPSAMHCIETQKKSICNRNKGEKTTMTTSTTNKQTNNNNNNNNNNNMQANQNEAVHWQGKWVHTNLRVSLFSAFCAQAACYKKVKHKKPVWKQQWRTYGAQTH